MAILLVGPTVMQIWGFFLPKLAANSKSGELLSGSMVVRWYELAQVQYGVIAMGFDGMIQRQLCL
jgi:hypothetical protein